VFAVKAAVIVTALAGMVTMTFVPEMEHAAEGAQDRLVKV
jgi:hypothetical protein